MSRNLTTMTDEEVFAVLDNYAQRLSANVVSFTNRLEVPSEELTFLSVALEYVKEVDERKFANYFDLLKTVEGEILDRTGLSTQ